MLSKSKRLSTEVVKEIVEKGLSFHSPFVLLRLIKAVGSSRFSVSVPKKVTKTAVSRNKIRRQVYSIIKKNELKIKDGFKIFIIMKVGSEKLDFPTLSVEIEKIFVKSGLLK